MASKLLFEIPVAPKLENVYDVMRDEQRIKMLVAHEVYAVELKNSVAAPKDYPQCLLTEVGPAIIAVPKHRDLTEEEVMRLVIT